MKKSQRREFTKQKWIIQTKNDLYLTGNVLELDLRRCEILEYNFSGQ